MTPTTFKRVCKKALKTLKGFSPIDTGNLRYNAIRGEFKDENTYVIYVDEDIAPYMPYTNEPWLSERWHGKKNPNESWFDKAVEDIVNGTAAAVHGKVK